MYLLHTSRSSQTCYPSVNLVAARLFLWGFFKDTFIILKQSPISTDHWDKQYKCNIASNEDSAKTAECIKCKDYLLLCRQKRLCIFLSTELECLHLQTESRSSNSLCRGWLGQSNMACDFLRTCLEINLPKSAALTCLLICGFFKLW